MIVLTVCFVGRLYIWMPPSLSELTPMIFNMGLTHLGSEASKYIGDQQSRLSKQSFKRLSILMIISVSPTGHYSKQKE